MKIYGVFLNNLVVFIFNSSNTIYLSSQPLNFLHNPPSHESVLFFGAKKRTKRNIHPSKASPQGEDANPGFGKTQIHAMFWQAGTSAYIA